MQPGESEMPAIYHKTLYAIGTVAALYLLINL